MELMEQSVESRRRVFGDDSVEAIEAAEKLGLLYNSLAMTSLYKGVSNPPTSVALTRVSAQASTRYRWSCCAKPIC
jgi:hypothetical protein